MKKILLISASALSLAIATSAFAAGNKVYLDQSGTDQWSDITQTGTNDTVGTSGNPFIQENWTGSGSNNLTINQGGDGNSVAKDITGEQAGTGNYVVINQSGKDSDVELQQVGTANGVAGIGWTNSLVYDAITQDFTANKSKIELLQSGNNNEFDLGQGGRGNTASVSQSGADAQVYVRQAVSGGGDMATGWSLPVGGTDNNITISQTTASLNYAIAVQGAGSFNNLTETQNGDLLAANIWQENGDGNYANSNQTGNNNAIGNATFNSYGADTPFVQNGSGNGLTNIQSGSYNQVNGSQTGTANYIYTDQYGANSATTGSTASLEQDGIFNRLWNYQSGPSDQITSTQNGIDNYVWSNQGGYAVASLTQSSFGNSSTGTQLGGAAGAANTASVTQSGTLGRVTYYQNGTSNTVAVTQTGMGNLSNTTQVGNGNTANVHQN